MNKSKELLQLLEGVSDKAPTYEEYLLFMDSLNGTIIDEGLLSKIGKSALKLFKSFKDELLKVASEFKIGFTDIVKAFKNKKIFSLLKVVGFKIKVLFKAIRSFAKLWTRGLQKVFKKISDSKFIGKLRSGAIKIDDLLNEYPILKKLTGIAIAGLLFYIWLNMSFDIDFESSFDLSNIALALSGNYSIADLFLSPSGLNMLVYLGTGLLGFSVPWLGGSLANLTAGITYTAFVMLKDSKYKDIIGRFKEKFA